jgi:hypothetical protein
MVDPMKGAPSQETMRELINQRERELIQRALKLRDQLAPIERELAEIRRAKVALGMEVGRKAQTRSGMLDVRPTFKGMAIKALDEHFRDVGATTQELLDFFRDAWGVDIDRASLSAQLSRLNLDDGAVVRSGKKWVLVPEAISEDELKSWGVIPAWSPVRK